MSLIYQTGDPIVLRPEWRDPGEDGTGYVVVEDRGDRVLVFHQDFADWRVIPTEVVAKDMILVPGGA